MWIIFVYFFIKINSFGPYLVQNVVRRKIQKFQEQIYGGKNWRENWKNNGILFCKILWTKKCIFYYQSFLVSPPAVVPTVAAVVVGASVTGASPCDTLKYISKKIM